MKYENLASLVFNQPILCSPEYAETICVVLQDKLDINTEGMEATGAEKREQELSVTPEGTLIVPILGSMTHRASFLDAMSGIQSYGAIQSKIQAGLDDPSVKSILLDMDSPGGSVAGAFDLRDYIYSIRGQKPIVALARDTMASAAYLIGSACDKVYTTQTGQVGSIGVVAMHLDQSAKNKQAGVKPTFIYAGEYKTAGNPHEPLKGAALEYLQESVNQSYDMFVDAVAEARGIDADEIRATEARVYRGQKAVEIGLADGVMTMDSALKELANSAPRVYQQMSNKGENMDKETAEKLEADLAKAQADAEKLRKDNETLRGYVIAEGYSITSTGIEKNAEPEMIEVEGTLVPKADLPEVVVKALEAKSEAELTAKATKEFSNFKPDVAKSLYSSFAGNETVMSALRTADEKMGEMLNENGNTSVDADMYDPAEKLNKMAKHYQAEHSVKFETAYAAVSQTAEGSKLLKEIYKKDK